MKKVESLFWASVLGLSTSLIGGCSAVNLAVSGIGLQQEAIRKSEIENRARNSTVKVYAGSAAASGTVVYKQDSIWGYRYFILTNHHVTKLGSSYRVTTPDGIQHEARLINAVRQSDRSPSDRPLFDLSVLSFLSPRSYGVARIAEDDLLPKADQELFTAGFPSSGSFQFKSAYLKWVPDRPLVGGYQLGFSGETAQGMSGGPIFNHQGLLVGINGQSARAILPDSYQYEDGSLADSETVEKLEQLNWAIPLSALKRAIPDLSEALYPVKVPNGMVKATIDLPGDLGKLNEKAQNFVVRVIGSGGPQSRGSGVIIARNGLTHYVVTASHVTRDANNPKGTYKIELEDGQSFEGRNKDIVEYQDLDLSILKFDSVKSYPRATILDSKAKESSVVVVSGFVGKNRFLSAGFPEKSGISSEFNNFFNENPSQLLYTAATTKGISGGAVMNLGGQLIGIHRAAEGRIVKGETLEQQEIGYSVGTPIQQLLLRLDGDGIQRSWMEVQSKAPLLSDASSLVASLQLIFLVQKPDVNGSKADWLAYANQLWRTGKYSDSANAFEQVLKRDDGNPVAWFGLGLSLKSNKNLSGAMAAFERATMIDPDYQEAWRELGWALLSSNQYQKAVKAFSKAIELTRADSESDRTRLIVYRIGAYTGARDYSEALNDLSTVFRLWPNNSLVYVLRGWVYAQSGSVSKAIADYNKAIELDSKNVEAYLNRGIAHRKLQQNSKALLDFTKAIELDPKSVGAYVYRGNIYLKSSQNPKALTDFTKALELDPKNANAFFGRGIAYYESGQNSKAIIDLNKAIELDPQNANAYAERGFAYNRSGQSSKAIVDFNKAIEIDPKNADAYVGRGLSYNDSGQTSKAIGDAIKAIELDPKNYRAYFLRGYGKFKQGQDKSFRNDLKTARELACNSEDKTACSELNKVLKLLR